MKMHLGFPNNSLIDYRNYKLGKTNFVTHTIKYQQTLTNPIRHSFAMAYLKFWPYIYIRNVQVHIGGRRRYAFLHLCVNVYPYDCCKFF